MSIAAPSTDSASVADFAQGLNAAQRRLWPDRAAVVIAGDAEKIRGELEALDVGPVVIADPAELEE